MCTLPSLCHSVSLREPADKLAEIVCHPTTGLLTDSYKWDWIRLYHGDVTTGRRADAFETAGIASKVVGGRGGGPSMMESQRWYRLG